MHFFKDLSLNSANCIKLSNLVRAVLDLHDDSCRCTTAMECKIITNMTL